MQDIMSRRAELTRKTLETDIHLDIVLDGTGQASVRTGVPFLDHMLHLFAVHGFFDLSVTCSGDTLVDDHHSVEDIGICLGRALRQALGGDLAGIARYGQATVPMDEALVAVAVDLCNRPYLHCHLPVSEEKIGSFDTALAKEFFRAVAQHAGMALHLDMAHGENGHHILEAAFKAWGRAMRQAVRRQDLPGGVLSSKGTL